MTITLRSTKGLALTYSELDDNFTDLDNRVDTKLASSSVSSYGLTLIDDTTAANARITLGLSTVAATGAYSDLSGTPAVYSLPIATDTILGGITVDGVTVTIDGAGVLSSVGSYALPTSSTGTLGGVKIDGTTITISGSGVISATGVGENLEIDGGNASTSYSTGDLEIDGGGA